MLVCKKYFVSEFSVGKCVALAFFSYTNCIQMFLIAFVFY